MSNSSTPSVLTDDGVKQWLRYAAVLFFLVLATYSIDTIDR